MTAGDIVGAIIAALIALWGTAATSLVDDRETKEGP